MNEAMVLQFIARILQGCRLDDCSDDFFRRREFLQLQQLKQIMSDQKVSSPLIALVENAIACVNDFPPEAYEPTHPITMEDIQIACQRRRDRIRRKELSQRC